MCAYAVKKLTQYVRRYGYGHSMHIGTASSLLLVRKDVGQVSGRKAWDLLTASLSFLSEVASLTSDYPGLEAVGCLAVVGRSWHPTRQPSQVQGVRWEGG